MLQFFQTSFSAWTFINLFTRVYRLKVRNLIIISLPRVPSKFCDRTSKSVQHTCLNFSNYKFKHNSMCQCMFKLNKHNLKPIKLYSKCILLICKTMRINVYQYCHPKWVECHIFVKWNFTAHFNIHHLY